MNQVESLKAFFMKLNKKLKIMRQRTMNEWHNDKYFSSHFFLFFEQNLRNNETFWKKEEIILVVENFQIDDKKSNGKKEQTYIKLDIYHDEE